MSIAVIMPVYNGARFLDRSLTAIRQSERAPDELIVVDDGSTDDSAAIAARHGARVIRLDDGPFGPAVARNAGGLATHADVLMFVDADVVVHADALGRIERWFTENASIGAVFGSYDDNPSDQGMVSRYKNLLNHYVHQNAHREATTFWAGCGAVRRPVFAAFGGFDERYRVSSIEDIELGARLSRAGVSIWSCPDVLCTHLKRWTFAGLIQCDLFRRAVPWSLLIGSSGSVPDDLNLRWESRLGAAAAWLLVVVLSLGLLTGHHWLWSGAGVPVVALAVCNAGLFRFYNRRAGLWFCLAAFGLHVCYLLYSSFTFVIVAGPLLAFRRSRRWLVAAARAPGVRRLRALAMCRWLAPIRGIRRLGSPARDREPVVPR
jgi:GT2 family glycosyltransferase